MPNANVQDCSRRDWLQQAGGGFHWLALATMLSHDLGRVVQASPTSTSSGVIASPPAPHHRPRARRVIQLFMNGGVSQMDTFDYKPALAKQHGKQVDFGLTTAVTSKPGAVMKSPFRFRQYGDSGRWVSSVFPNLARHVDELAFLMSMRSKTNVHGPASYMQNTGYLTGGFPAMGAWISYGLGRLTDDLPTFVVLPDHRGFPYNNTGNFSAAFLPAAHSSVIVDPNADTPIANLRPATTEGITTDSERETLRLLTKLNRDHLRSRPGDSRLEARIASFQLAARMQLAAPDVLDLAQETPATHRAYGLDREETRHFGRNCLVARRLIERDVRFVQVWSGMGGPKHNWDNHTDIHTELPAIAQSVDRPMAALLGDLKQRGLLDDTLVIWTTEFGRMPFTQGATGRDHNGGTFVSWLAGAGIKPGATYGQSDDFAYETAEHGTYCYDLHATILHLLGLDHRRLTYRHNGIDRRLTDVHGHVIDAILA